MADRRTPLRSRRRKASDGYGNDRPSRLRLLWRQKKQFIRPIALLALLITVGIGITAILHDSDSEKNFAPLRARLAHMMPLRIKHIDVTGRRLTKEDALTDALGAHLGEGMFTFSVEAARKRLDALPFVDHATVQRHLPDTIIVHLFERSPVAVWQIDGHFQLINAKGDRVPDQGMTGKDAEAFMKLPLVVGKGANTDAMTLIDALDAHPEVKRFVVASVRVGERRWNLALHDGTTILLPEGHAREAIERLARYQASDRLLERAVTSIDMRLPDRMTIHRSPIPPAPPPSAETPASPPAEASGQPAAKPDLNVSHAGPHQNKSQAVAPDAHGNNAGDLL